MGDTTPKFKKILGYILGAILLFFIIGRGLGIIEDSPKSSPSEEERIRSDVKFLESTNEEILGKQKEARELETLNNCLKTVVQNYQKKELRCI